MVIGGRATRSDEEDEDDVVDARTRAPTRTEAPNPNQPNRYGYVQQASYDNLTNNQKPEDNCNNGYKKSMCEGLQATTFENLELIGKKNTGSGSLSLVYWQCIWLNNKCWKNLSPIN